MIFLFNMLSVPKHIQLSNQIASASLCQLHLGGVNKKDYFLFFNVCV